MYKLVFFYIYLDGLVFLFEIHMDLNAFIVSFFFWEGRLHLNYNAQFGRF